MLYKLHYLLLGMLAYGFYGAGLLDPFTNSFSPYSIFFLILPLITTFIVILLSEDTKEENLSILYINKNHLNNDLLIFIFISVFLTSISLNFLSLSISNDAYYYATSGLIHVIKIAEILVSKTSFFDDLNVSNLIQILSFFIISGFMLIGFFLYRLNLSLKIKVVIFLSLIFLLRFSVSILGGNQNHHPPFVGFPFFLLSPLLGISDISAKLSFFIPYLFFAFVIYRAFNNYASRIVSAILSIALLSIPGILFLGSTFEQSFWGILCFSISLILISQNKNIHYQKIFFLITIFCFFRSSSILACIPVALHFLFLDNQNLILKEKIIKLIQAALPILIFSPFFLFALVEYPDTNIGRISFDENIFLVSWYIEIIKNTIDAFSIAPILFLALLILITFKHRLFSIGLLFFAVLILIYNLIDETGHPKYQLEYIVPILIFYLILFLKKYSSQASRVFISIIAVGLIINNINLIWNFKDQCLKSSAPYNEQKFEYEAKFGCNFVSQPPFKLTDAYQELRQLDGFSSMYLPGVYYDGTLSQIMNGATVQEWRSIMEILKNQKEIERSHKIDWRGSNALDINQNNKIKFVIIADVLDATKLKENLIELGWIIRSSYAHSKFYTNVTLLERRK